MNEAEFRKQLGLELVENNGSWFVSTMRDEAKRLIRERGVVTADDLHVFASQNNIEPHHPNAWGAVFRSKAFRCVGYVNSERPASHARVIKQWGLA